MDLTLLKRLVNTNSHSYNPEGLKKTRLLLEEAFLPLEGKKSLFGDTLVYKKRPRAPIQIFLGGHYDTVYPKSSPFQKITPLSKTIWRGPGITDMKGGLVIMLTALLAFEKTPLAKNIGWRLVLNADEEIASPLSAPVIEKVALGCHAAFLFEPAFADGSLVSSRKGSMNMVIKAKGKAAHAGRDLHLGINAITILASLISYFKDTPGINFGEIHGGHAFNIVPSYAELKVNLRSDDESDFKKFMDKLKTYPEKDAIECSCLSYRAPKSFDKKAQKLMKALNYPYHFAPSGGVCDGNQLASMGIPTIDTLGAVGGKIHTEDEYIEIPSLDERARLFFEFLVKVSKGEVELC